MIDVMEAKFGLGIVGAGMAASPHVKSLQELRESVDIKGFFTRSADSREQFAARSGFPAVDSLDVLLDDPKVDALLILTPPDARQEIAKRAGRAGKHLLMEKPLERTLAASERIVDICDDAGVTLGVVFQHRFREASVALRSLIAEGALGEICSVSLSVPWWRPQSYYDEPGRGTLARDGGGVLMTQAIHVLDLMLSITGPAAEVQAMTGTTMHRMETEDFAAGAVRFASGALGSVMATVTTYPGKDEVLILNCRKATATLAGGALTIDWLEGTSEQVCAPAAAGQGASPMDFTHDWHKALIQDFVDAVRSGRRPLSDGHSALHVHRLIDAMLKSSASGRRQAIE
jgi:predicted dehydrogenase